MVGWNNKIFECFEGRDGGGPGLCLYATCCHFCILGDINDAIGGPGGWCGGCCGSVILGYFIPCGDVCAQAYCALEVAKKAGVEENPAMACLCSLCCSCCYAQVVYKETVFQGQAKMKGAAPGQVVMVH